MSEISTGGCLCGAVTYRITGPFKGFFLCHCSRCRKATGSAHAANLFSDAAQIDWLSGGETVQNFRLEGTRFTRSYCPGCGASVPTVSRDGTRMMVPAGGLDSDVALRPDAHIFCASRANWDSALDAVIKLGAGPGSDEA